MTLSEKWMHRVWRFDPERELPGAGELPGGQQPCRSPNNTAARGQLGKSPQAQILAPLDTDSCGSTSVYAVLYFFVRMGVKELEMCPAFSGSRQKVVIQYAKDFL